MKMLPASLFAVLLLPGRAIGTINVLEKKDTPKPFTNILAVYVDGDMDFSAFDSTTYNICKLTDNDLICVIEIGHDIFLSKIYTPKAQSLPGRMLTGNRIGFTPKSVDN